MIYYVIEGREVTGHLSLVTCFVAEGPVTSD